MSKEAQEVMRLEEPNGLQVALAIDILDNGMYQAAVVNKRGSVLHNYYGSLADCLIFLGMQLKPGGG